MPNEEPTARRHRRPVSKTALCCHSASAMVGALLLFVAGCSANLETTYGEAAGYSATHSINGFGAFYEMFDVAGWRTKRAYRLSPRLDTAKTIVWTPASTRTPQHLNTWFDDWLGAQPDRTLVYVIPDGTLESHYWETLRPQADPAQRFEYRRRAARRRVQEIAERLSRQEHGVEGWYELRPLKQPVLLDDLEGPWVDEAREAALPGDLQISVTPFDESDGVPSGPPLPTVMPSFPGESEALEEMEPRSSDDPLTFDPLVSANGHPLVFSLRAPDWQDSEAIVVIGPSTLTNYALTEPLAQDIAWRLIDRCGVPGQVAFITNGDEGLNVRHAGEASAGPSGMELLTVWPLNVVTMHAAAIGLIVLLALLPIFGRPRQLPTASDTDFSRHVLALGDLMAKGGDAAYARRQISDYFAIVRGEPESRWVLPPEPSDVLQPPAPGLAEAVSKETQSPATEGESAPSGRNGDDARSASTAAPDFPSSTDTETR